MTKLTHEHKRKISEGVKKQWMEGRGNPSGILSREARKKARLKMLGHKRTPKGEKHHMWKGENASYAAKHIWVNSHFGKANKCENPPCKYPRKNWDGKIMDKPKRYEWANISGEYKRKRDDWKMLCPSCHRTKDKNNIIT